MSCPNNRWSGRHWWGPIKETKCGYRGCTVVGMHRRCALCDCVQVGKEIPKPVRDQHALMERFERFKVPR